MKLAKIALLASALIAGPAAAQEAGTMVYGPQGGEVGKVLEVQADGKIVIDTGKHEVPMPKQYYSVSEKGVTIPVGQAQLNQMADAQIAKAKAKAAEALAAALVVDAAVMTADHQPLGTVESITGDNVVVARSDEAGTRMTLTRDFFTAKEGHGLMANLTMAQVEEALAAAAPAAE